jgi:flagellar motility protein MotE (MotC chaperone)
VSRMIKLLSIAVILFSVAASASWYMQYKQYADSESPKMAEPKTPKAVSAKAGGADANAPRPLSRPPATVETDRIAQFSSTLHQQQAALTSREQQIVMREKQMDLIHLDIKSEHKKLDGIRKEIQTELALVQEKLELLEKRAAEFDKKVQQLTRDSEELDGKKTEISGLEVTNVKKLATIYDKMDPEAGAQGIEQMVEKGKLDMAVIILSNMGQRQAAGLLSEVSKQDPGIAVQLIDRMRFYKTSQTSPKRLNPE